MDSSNSMDTIPILGKCRCCLQSGILNELWTHYIVGDKIEIYGEMLADCYSIPLHQPIDYDEYICESCIDCLRNAIDFKEKVLSSEQIILQSFVTDYNTLNDKIKYDELQKEETNEIDNDVKTEDPVKEDDSDFEIHEKSMENISLDESDTQDSQQDVEYLEIEYLDDADNTVKSVEKGKVQDPLSEASAAEEPKRKWPKKKKKWEVMRSYKKYTQADLKACLHTIRSGTMSLGEAAVHFNIPKKTLAYKVKEDPALEEDGDIPEINAYKEKPKFLQEIETILTYTNATPYKTKAGWYYCPYCPNVSSRKPIDKAEKLRKHINTEHASERISGIENIMKPNWLHEVCKLDIENLMCTVCSVAIDTWNDMFDHLKAHGEDLDEAYSKVIPYKLTENLECALCGQKFLHYHNLDAHMNAHYDNYICGKCGDTFLAENRFKKHVETHSGGRYPCPHCHKVFSLEKYRKKHLNGVHSQEKRFPCAYCTDKFRTDYSRHLHVLKYHGEKVKTIICEFCSRTFDWRPYYLKHLRLQHKAKERKYECQLCDKKFYLKHQLRDHEQWHEGDNNHVCPICKKKFVSKQYLKKHIGTHPEEIHAFMIVSD